MLKETFACFFSVGLTLLYIFLSQFYSNSSSSIETILIVAASYSLATNVADLVQPRIQFKEIFDTSSSDYRSLMFGILVYIALSITVLVHCFATIV